MLKISNDVSCLVVVNVSSNEVVIMVAHVLLC